MVILRIFSKNGVTIDGIKEKKLEQVLNELEQQGFSVLSHRITFSSNSLIEVVLMKKEK